MYKLFIDFEATDKFPTQYTGITEIAAVLYDVENDQEIDKFHKLCYPKVKRISPDAVKLNGYSLDYLSQFENEDVVIGEFISWIIQHMRAGNIENIVGQNYYIFDHNLITKRAAFFNWTWPFKNRDNVIDTYRLAKGVKSARIPCHIADTGHRTPTGRVSYRQEHIADFYGIEYDAHKAIDDIYALIKIYKRMVGKQPKKQSRSDLGF